MSKKIYSPRDPERQKALKRVWRISNPVKRKEYARRYNLTERGMRLKREGVCRSNKKLRIEMIEAYGGKCSCCGESEYCFLTLEHTKKGGVQHRKSIGGNHAVLRKLRLLGWPKDDFTVLCYNCNCGANSNNGLCPHKSKGGVVDG